MTICFTEDDSRILIGSDDKIVRSLDIAAVESGWQARDATLLKENSLIEGSIINAPMCMAFNSDATQIGVSYRGYALSVWSTSETRLIGRCKRSKQFRADHARPSANWFAVDRFTWNPVTGHLIGCYKDGCVFKWHPVTEENQEAVASADEVAAIADGKLFATSSSDGIVKIWNFDFFSVIYQLSSGDLVSGLTFGPDCKRFYDLRGSAVNGCEPNSLIRLSESDELLSDTASEKHAAMSVSHVSEASLVPFEPVCALAAARGSNLYCAGDEDGMVNLYGATGNIALPLAKFPNFLNVDHLVWGEDGHQIVASDLGGDIIVKRLKFSDTVKGKIEMESFPSPRMKLEGRAIHQLILKGDSTLLLICSHNQGDIWSLQEGAMHHSRLLQEDATRIWLNHPERDDLLLAFSGSDVKTFRWTDLTEIACSEYQKSRPSLEMSDDREPSLMHLKLSEKFGSGQTTIFATRAMQTQDQGHVLVKFSEGTMRRTSASRFLIFDNTAFNPDVAGQLSCIQVPVEVSSRVHIALGVFSGSRMVFLDDDLWLCTYKLRQTLDSLALTRHFFVPRDWVSAECLAECCVLEDGTFLVPRDGEVAVIRSDIGTTDMVI
jgi:WD40 repeat protein